MKLWDLSTQHCIQTVVAHRAEVWSLGLNPEQDLLLSGSNEGELKAWKIEPGVLADGIKESKNGEVRCCLEVVLTLHIPSSCRKQSTPWRPSPSLRPIVFLRSLSTLHSLMSSFNHMTDLWKFSVCEPMKKYARNTLAEKNGLKQRRPWVRPKMPAPWPTTVILRRSSLPTYLCHTWLRALLARSNPLRSLKRRVRKMLFRYVATFRQLVLCPMPTFTALLRVIE